MKNNVTTNNFLICIAFQIFLSGIEAAEVCEWNFRSCPEDINNQVITVPDKVISLAPNIRACDAVTKEMSADTTAVMFVIDNSSSMSSGSGVGGGNDAQGARFMVTSALIDTISKAKPGARVGLVVFRSGLYFDSRTHNILSTLEGITDTGDYKYQAYLPPLKLDSTYSFDTASMTGLQILKYFLRTTEVARNVELVYEPGFNMVSGTNINYGFDAALQGFSRIPEKLIPKRQRFIIFFSDGEPTEGMMSLNEGAKPLYYFKQGLNTPTTFTFFLHNTERVPPDSLVEMTENIRNNGYSETNPRSDIWITKVVSHDSLMSLFMHNVMNTVINKNACTPAELKLNGKISTSYADGFFHLSDTFRITKDTTGITLEITYQVFNNGNVYDSTTQTAFTILRSDKVNQPSEGYLKCWSPVHIKSVTASDQTNKEIQFSFSAGIFRFTNISGSGELKLFGLDGKCVYSCNFNGNNPAVRLPVYLRSCNSAFLAQITADGKRVERKVLFLKNCMVILNVREKDKKIEPD